VIQQRVAKIRHDIASLISKEINVKSHVG
jgi:hypothetical protein